MSFSLAKQYEGQGEFEKAAYTYIEADKSGEVASFNQYMDAAYLFYSIRNMSNSQISKYLLEIFWKMIFHFLGLADQHYGYNVETELWKRVANMMVMGEESISMSECLDWEKKDPDNLIIPAYRFLYLNDESQLNKCEKLIQSFEPSQSVRELSLSEYYKFKIKLR